LNPFVLEYTPSHLLPYPGGARASDFRRIGRLRFHSKHLTKLNSRPIRFSKIIATHRRCFTKARTCCGPRKAFDTTFALLPDNHLLQMIIRLYGRFRITTCWRNPVCVSEKLAEASGTLAFDLPVRSLYCSTGTVSTGSFVRCPFARLPNSGRGCKFFLFAAHSVPLALAASRCFRDKTSLSDSFPGWQAIDSKFLWKSSHMFSITFTFNRLQRCFRLNWNAHNRHVRPVR